MYTIKIKNIFGFKVTLECLANFAVSRGFKDSPDHKQLLAEEGLLLLDEESDIDLEWRLTGSSFDEKEIVATLYTNRDFDVESMSFPQIPKENMDKLAELLGRPGEKPQWYPCLL